jgi:MFS family permease
MAESELSISVCYIIRVQINPLTTLAGSFVVITFGIGTGFSPNYITLLLMRALLGFGVGGLNVTFDLLAEFLPQKARGTFLTNVNYFW